MKKILLPFILLFILAKAYAVPTGIVIGGFTGPVCAGAVSSVNYTSTGNTDDYVSTNVFYVEISDATGNFPATPVNIGTLLGFANAGTVSLSFPSTLASGTGYKLRIVSSNPSLTSTATTAFTVNAAPSVNISPVSSVCLGTNTLNVNYTLSSGSPDQYSVTWDAAGISAGLSNVALTALPASPITLSGLSGVPVGQYTGSIVVRNSTTGCSRDVTTETVCGVAAENGSVSLTSPTGLAFTSIHFASYGSATGTCGNFVKGSCDAATSISVVNSYCIGQSSCVVPASNGVFGDPCVGTIKNLLVELEAATFSIIIAPTTATITATKPTMCTGEYTTLTATPGQTYLWNTGETTQSITVSPASTTTYSCTVNNLGCNTSTGTITITVNSSPSATLATSTPTVCSNSGSYNLAFTSPLNSPNQYSVDWGDNVTAMTDIAFTNLPGNYIPLTGLTSTAGAYPATIYLKNTATGCVGNLTGATMCNSVQEGTTLTMTAPGAGKFISIPFASFGNPTGACGTYATGSCHYANSIATIRAAAYNNNTFNIVAHGTVFSPDPCSSTIKTLAVQAIHSTFSLTVNAATSPTITTPAAQSVCHNANEPALTITTSGTSITWVNSNTAIGLAASGSDGTFLYQIPTFLASNTTGSNTTANITVTPVSAACSGTPVTYVMTVSPAAIITGSTTVCIGNTTTLAPTSGGTWVSNAPGIATVNSTSGLVTGVAAGNVTFTFTNTTPNCNSTTPAVTVGALSTTYNATGTFTTPPGVTSLIIQSWGGGGGGGNGAGARGGGGGGAFSTGTITGLSGSTSYNVTVGTGGTVGNNGNASSFNTQIQANGGSQGANPGGGAGGTASTITGFISNSYAGGNGGTAPAAGTDRAGGGGGGSALTTAAGTAGTAGGNSTNAATPGGAGTGSGGSGSSSDGSPAATAGTAPGGGGGGRGNNGGTAQAGANGRIIVTIPTPTIAYTGSPFCSSNAPVSVTRTSISGGVYSSTLLTGTGTLTVNSSTGEISPSSYTGTGNSTFTISYDYGCGVATTTVTINGAPTASAGGFQTVCVNSTVTVSGASSSNGTILWTENGTGSITAGATTLTPTYTPAAGDAGTTVTLTMTVTNSPCTAATATYTVGVQALPVNKTVAAAASPICSGTSTSITVASSDATATYQLRNNTGNVNIGSPVTGNGGTISLLTGTLISSTTFNVLASTSTGCTNQMGITPTVTVTPIPAAASNTTSTAAICSNQTKALVATPSGGTWSVQSGTGSIAGTTYTPAGATTATIRYTIAATGGCAATTSDATFTVTANPGAANNTTTTATICSNQTKALVATPSGGTWSVQSGTGSIAGTTYTPAGATTATIRYTIAATGGCAATTSDATFTVTANPGAATNTTTTAAICSNQTKALVATPSGGTWSVQSGTGSIAGTTYTPAGATTATIRYTIAATGGCTATTSDASFTVTADPGTASNSTSTAAICSNQTKALVATPSGGTWSVQSGTGSIAGTTYTPAGATTATIRYTIAATGGCAATTSDASFTVTADPGTASNTTSTAAICSNQTKALAATPSGGTWSVQSGTGSIAGTTYTPAGATTATIRYTIAATGGCAATTSDATFTVTANPGAANNTTTTATICSNQTKALVATPSGGTWSVQSGTGSIAGTTYTPAGATTATIRYTIAATGGCAATTSDATFTVTADPGTASNSTSTAAICSNQTKALVATPSGGTWSVQSGTGSIAGTTYTPAGATTATIRYTIAATGGCAATTSDATFTVTADPGTASNSTSTAAICSNQTKALVATPSGGTWSVQSGTGSIAGTTYTPAGATTATIRYTIAATGGCAATTSDATFTVTADPGTASNSTSTAAICSNQTKALVATPSGGTWSVQSGTGSIAGTTYTPAGATTATIRYTIAATGGCAATTSDASFTVTADPGTASNSTSTAAICSNQTKALVATPSGGTWSVQSGTGSIAGTTYTPSGATTATIRYTIAATGGCAATTSDASFTVTADPGTASNTTSTAAICSNQTKALAATPSGGTWSVQSGTGSIAGTTYTPAGATTATIRYTIAATGGCAATTSDATFTVTADPGTASNSTSTAAICSNQTKALVATPSGGTWSVQSGTGSIAGTTYTPAGATTATIRYTIAATGGCAATTSDATFTVTANPGAANNTTTTATICSNQTKALVATPSGGTWSVQSGTGSIAGTTYTPAGATTATIRYTIAATGGCAATTSDATFTVTADPGTASNSTSTAAICSNQTKALVATPSGGTWSVQSGTGSIAGTTYTPAGATTATIRYTIAATGGCAATTSDATFTVTANPGAANNTTTTATICSNQTKALVATPSGGTWSVQSGTGSIAGTTYTPAGATTATIRYTIAATGGCAATTSDATFTVTADPGTASNTTSTAAICSNQTKALVATPSGGTWSVQSGTGSIAGTTYTPASATTATIRYTIAATGGCAATTSDATFTVTANPGAANNTTTTATICSNQTKALVATPSGGTWSVQSGTGSIAGTTYTPAGATTATIRYTIAATGGCAATTSDATFTVTADPGTASNSTSTAAICSNQTKALVATPSGGTWSVQSGTGSIAGTTYTPAGATTATIRYTIAATGGCAATTSDATFTVTANPGAANNTTTTATICSNQTKALVATPSGGTWSVQSGTGSIAGTTYTPAGATTATIRYTIAATGGCAATTSDATFTVTADPGTASNSTSTAAICSNQTKALVATPSGGTWSVQSGTGSIAGTTYTPASATTATIRYTIAATGGCAATTSDATFTVNLIPSVSITGSNSICVGGNTTLSPTTGGTWVSSNPAFASVTNAGLVTGLAAGSPTFSFTNSITNCINTTSSVTINALPTVSITGNSSITVGNTTTLAPTSGGTWVSNSPGVASVSNTGIVTSLTVGTVNFTFTNAASPNCTNTTSNVFVSYPMDLAGLGTNAPSSGAYSVRKLSSSYPGFGMEVRRTNDNATANVAFNGSNVIDATSIVTITNAGSSGLVVGSTMTFSAFYGLNTVTVQKWYDQSGLSRDASQTILASQPRIVNAGVLETVNGRLSVYFGGTPQSLETDPFTAFNTSATFNAVTKVNNNSTYNAFVTKTTNNWPGPLDFYYNTTNNNSTVVRGDGTSSGYVFNTTPAIAFDPNIPLSVWSYSGSASSASIYFNDATILSQNTPSAFGDGGRPLVLGSRDDLVTGLNGWISEAVTFVSVSGPDLSALHNNQMPYYNFVPTITSSSLSGANSGCLGAASSSPSIQQFNVSGGYLLSDITLNAPAGFEISTSSGSGYANTINLLQGPVTHAVPNTTIYVRLSSSAALGNNSGNVSITTTGAVTQNIAVTGTVYSYPSSISPATIPTICTNSVYILSNPTSGGTWSSATPSVATINSSGVVTAVTGGTSVISYTVNGCSSTNTVTVDGSSGVTQTITGASSLCLSQTPTYASTTPGGSWSSSDPSILTINTSSGLVTPVTSGTAIINYSVVTGACTSGNNKTVTIYSLPVIYTITGGGAYCSGGTGVVVGLSNSQVGVNYQLKIGGVNTGSPLSGTGSSLSFGNQTASGNYTIVATNATTSCSSTTSTSVNIVANAIPTISLNAVPNICFGTATNNVTYSGTTGSPNQYSIDWDAAANTAGFTDVLNAALPGSPIVLTGLGAVSSGSYTGTLTVRNSVTGCVSAGITGGFTINSIPTITASPIPTICIGTGSASLPYTATSGTPDQYSIDWNGAANTAGVGDVTNSTLPSSPISITGLGAVASGTYTGNLSVRNSGTGCTSPNQSVSFVIDADSYTWKGTTNSAWNTPSNWFCGVVPVSSADVNIASSLNDPVLPATVTSIQRLNIGTGATLTLPDAGTLVVNGNWSNSGTFSTTKGTVEFKGASAQTLIKTNGTESFYNLNFEGNNLTVNSDVEIKGSGTLLVKTGTLDVTAGSKMILRSVAPLVEGGIDNTARLGRVTGTITTTSSFQTERYIDIPSIRTDLYGLTGNKATILLAPAVKNPTASAWLNGMSINYAVNLSSYSELNEGSLNTGWRYGFTTTTTVYSGRGYKITVGRDNTDDLISVAGAPYVGNLSMPITYTPAATQGWNLIGNPYPCEINWETLYNNNSSVISPNLYMMDPYNTANNNSTYYVYQANTGITTDPRTSPSGRTGTNGMYIASSQGFFVTALQSGNVVFSESVKPNAPFENVYGNFRKEPNQLIRLQVKDSSSVSEAIINFNANAKDGYDPLYDAENITSGTNTIYTVAGNKKLVINGVSSLNTNIQIPLVVESAKKGLKKFKVNELSFEAVKCYLYDAYLKKYMLIESGKEYSFEFTADALSGNASRFTIVSKLPVITSYSDEESINANRPYIHPNPSYDYRFSIDLPESNSINKIDILDLSGNVVYSEANLKSVLSLDIELPSTLTAGAYTVRYTAIDKVIMDKIMLVK